MPDKNLKLSVSKVKTFLQCKKQFEYVYILKFPRKDKDYHIFGKFCHKVLEDFYISYINGSVKPFNVEMGNAYKSALNEFSDKMTKEMKKECWEIINSYLKFLSDNKKKNINENVIACEKNFELLINGNIVLNGMIDRVQIDSDGIIHVADYKTTKNKKYLKDDWFQLLTYAYVMLQEDPSIKKVRASYILLRHDFDFITTEFFADDIIKIHDQYVDYAKKIIEEKEFKPNPTNLCSFCDFFDICDSAKKNDWDKSNFSKTGFGEVSW